MFSLGEQSSETTAGSGLLVGRFDHALDPKKRFTIPAGWRELMGSPAYVYVFPDPKEKCLNLLPPAEMEGRLRKLRQRALFDKGTSLALRVFGEYSEQVSLDVQGRIRIKDKLLKFAMLDETVAMIGALDRVQLWSPALVPEEKDVDQVKLADAYEVLQL
jgi:division/cell wall cluster transcriptional repressor MraZ